MSGLRAIEVASGCAADYDGWLLGGAGMTQSTGGCPEGIDLQTATTGRMKDPSGTFGQRVANLLRHINHCMGCGSTGRHSSSAMA